MSFGSELVSDIGRSGLKIRTGEIIWNPGSINTAAEAVQALTVEGVGLGDWVVGVSSSIDTGDLIVTANVVAANSVEISLGNLTGGAVDLASSTWRVLVLSHQ